MTLTNEEVVLVPISSNLVSRLRAVIKEGEITPILQLSDRALVEAALEMKLSDLEPKRLR